MGGNYKRSLFIFRRDLRLNDNLSLNIALRQSEFVIPCFIFDDRQIGPKNSYKSPRALLFMLNCLDELNISLKNLSQSTLFFFHGEPSEIVERLIQQKHIDAVFCNRDYTPFSLKRDEYIEKVCAHYSVPFISTNDCLLNNPEKILTNNGTPYTIFTPFYKKAIKSPVAEPEPLAGTHFYKGTIAGALENPLEFFKKIAPQFIPSPNLQIGRENALSLLKNLNSFSSYHDTRDIPSIQTTHLSHHNKFGTVSIREVYHTVKNSLDLNHGLIRNLYWRDFFYQVAYNSPFVFGEAYKKKFDHLVWQQEGPAFSAWCKGETGFPLIDAGMRELIETGFMHNRVRMLVASFLTKDLRIDWRLGEQFFAQQLIDYDPAVNNGNWQWAASTGCDAQPYFRIFNPWIQQKKFDPDGSYIYRWIPELRTLKPKQLHQLFNKNNLTVKQYPHPLVNHQEEARKTKTWFISTS